MSIKFKQRPTCACGDKMSLVEYNGYYDSFRYWECNQCEIDEEIQNENIRADREWIGAYA